MLFARGVSWRLPARKSRLRRQDTRANNTLSEPARRLKSGLGTVFKVIAARFKMAVTGRI